MRKRALACSVRGFPATATCATCQQPRARFRAATSHRSCNDHRVARADAADTDPLKDVRASRSALGRGTCVVMSCPVCSVMPGSGSWAKQRRSDASPTHLSKPPRDRIVACAGVLAAVGGAATADAAKKQIMVYGDSNTWGWKPADPVVPTTRYPLRRTWPHRDAGLAQKQALRHGRRRPQRSQHRRRRELTAFTYDREPSPPAPYRPSVSFPGACPVARRT